MNSEKTKYLTIFKEYVCILEEKIEQDKNILICNIYTNNKNSENIENIKKIEQDLRHYLDLETDYDNIFKKLKQNPKFKQAVEYGKGIRILNQELLEMIISYIISANNNINNIKRSVNIISQKCGEKIEFEYNGEKYTKYLFPSLEKLKKLTIEDMKDAKTGFRANRLIDTISKLNLEYLEKLKTLTDQELLEELTKFNGIGPKVANCIMLFGMHRIESFPIDVWVRRVMSEIFFNGIEQSDKKILEVVKDIPQKGIAQQCLFYWRKNETK